MVIPSYRGERWIDIAISSIVDESAEGGVEVLVIDSSSTRATLEIAEAYADRLSLRTFHRLNFGSWHQKTNFGVEMASSAHVCWLGVYQRFVSNPPHACYAFLRNTGAGGG